MEDSTSTLPIHTKSAVSVAKASDFVQPTDEPWDLVSPSSHQNTTFATLLASAELAHETRLRTDSDEVKALQSSIESQIVELTRWKEALRGWVATLQNRLSTEKGSRWNTIVWAHTANRFAQNVNALADMVHLNWPTQLSEEQAKVTPRRDHDEAECKIANDMVSALATLEALEVVWKVFATPSA